MEYIYSALLLHSAGKKIDEKAVEKVLKSAGIEPDQARIKALVASLTDVNIDEAISTATLSQAAPATQAVTEAPKEEKKEEKKKEEEAPSEEEAISGLGALFG